MQELAELPPSVAVVGENNSSIVGDEFGGHNKSWTIGIYRSFLLHEVVRSLDTARYESG